MTWNGNGQVFKTYVKGNDAGDGKSPATKVKGRDHILTFEEASKFTCFGGMLQEDIVDISFDTEEASQKFWDMADQNGWECLILENEKNGHIHSFWKDTKHRIQKDGKDKKLAVGLIADIHSKGTYIPLRVHSFDRFPPSYEPQALQEIPDELIPVETQINLMDLGEGDGRNDELFKYILILQSQLVLDREGIKKILNNINRFIFAEPLSDEEMDVITRDEAFEKPSFYSGKTFLHHVFADYMKNQFHMIRMNGQLHVFNGKVYVSGYRNIESKMLEVIPTLKATARTEVLKLLEIITPEVDVVEEENLIAFRNGIFDLTEEKLIPFSHEHVITNIIPWDFNVNAYSELCDKTLNKIACNNPEIRSLLEECLGYCFFRHNELSKSFFLTGEGSNGKSTFLDMVRNVLGRGNYVSLDLDELSERFSTSTMFGKMANIGDDISDEFLQGKAIATFKKVVSGNDIKAENKGQDAYFFKPTVKLLFSANEIPRMRNKGFKAIERRLVIIPFNARFSKDDPDFDSQIIWKLKKQDVAEYMIQLGIQGLKRVLANNSFTECQIVKDELESFKRDNNPILVFLDEVPEEEILNQETKEVFKRYQVFCSENGFQQVAMQTFTKELKKAIGCDRKDVRVNGRKVIIFTR